MRVDLPDVPHVEARSGSHRALLWTVLLPVLVVAAAGISGITHFAGPRWLPDWKIAQHAQKPHKLPPRSPAAPLRVAPRHSAGSFPLGLVVWIVIGVVAVASLCCCGDGGSAD